MKIRHKIQNRMYNTSKLGVDHVRMSISKRTRRQLHWTLQSKICRSLKHNVTNLMDSIANPVAGELYARKD